jgi:hypothetical protein
MTTKISRKAATLAKGIFLNTRDNNSLCALAPLREAISFQVSSELANFILASLYIGITKSRQVFYEIVKKHG